MPYTQSRKISMKNSTSGVCGNLACLFNADKKMEQFAVLNKGHVNVTTCSSDFSIVNNKTLNLVTKNADMLMALTACWLRMPTRTLFVVAYDRGVQMFEGDGSSMVFAHAVRAEANHNLNKLFLRGIAANDTHVFVGASTGAILNFAVPPKGQNVQQDGSIQLGTCAIQTLASSDKKLLFAGDEQGVVSMIGEDRSVICKTEATKFPAVAMVCYKSWVFVGQGNGSVRVYNGAQKLEPTLEISAHFKPLYSLDISTDGKLVTAGEDTMIQFFDILKQNDDDIELRHAETVKITDSPIVGVKFHLGHSAEVAVSCYESTDIIFFAK